MRRYSLLHPFYLSFYSKPLYRDVALHWQGVGLAYLLVLLSLSTIPGVLRLGSIISKLIEADAPAVVSQIPPMTLTNGRLSLNAKQPYVIMGKDGSTPLAIIDTTGARKTLDGTAALLLVTETRILIRQDKAAPHVLELAELGDLTIDRRIVFEWLDSFDELFPFMLYPFALFVSLALHGTFAVMLGLTAYVASRRSGQQLTPSVMIRLAAVSLTPSVIVGTLLSAAAGQPPYWWAAALILSSGYMLYGIRAQTASEGLDKDAGGPL